MRIPRKSALVVLASISIAGLAGASAASFGGLTAGSIGSDDAVVAACDAGGITVAYTTAYNATAQKYLVTGANFTNVDAACNGKAASFTLRNGATALQTISSPAITVTGGAFSLTFATGADASAANGSSLIISG